MKNKTIGFLAGLAIGTVAFTLAVRQKQQRAAGVAWQKQRRIPLDVLACPDDHSSLSHVTLPDGEHLVCRVCKRSYPVVGGIAQFIQPQALTGMNRRFAHLYDWFSWWYRAFSKIAFAYIGMSEEQARREITDRLEPGGGPILEVSIGPGVNLPYLVDRPDAGEIFGLDISPGQLDRCRTYAAQKGWEVHLQLGNAEQLPYLDNTFDGVFHIGGINFFNDKKQAIQEMVRVARPGARILIADETEKGARAYEKFLPGFKRTAGPERAAVVPPVGLVPLEMEEVSLGQVWKGWLYCIEFRKP